MLSPVLLFDATSRAKITAGAAQAADLVVEGIGFLNSGRLPIDTNAPAAGASVMRGIARNSSGAVHGTTTTAATDSFLGGLRISAAGQLVYVDGAPVGSSNGQPVDANGAMATTAV